MYILSGNLGDDRAAAAARAALLTREGGGGSAATNRQSSRRESSATSTCVPTRETAVWERSAKMDPTHRCISAIVGDPSTAWKVLSTAAGRSSRKSRTLGPRAGWLRSSRRAAGNLSGKLAGRLSQGLSTLVLSAGGRSQSNRRASPMIPLSAASH